MTNLSKNFSLDEFTRTSRKILNKPNQVEYQRLIKVAEQLQKVLDQFGTITVTSGFRCKALNDAVGGVASSGHVFGVAVDFVPADSSIKLQDIFKWIIASDMPTDQIVLEMKNTNWIHWSMVRPGFQTKPRHERLVFRNGKFENYDPKVDYGV